MDVSLSDLGVLADVAQKVDRDPFALLGRIIGLSPEETRAGIPVWAWVTVAAGVGVYVGVVHGNRLIPQKLRALGRGE